MSKPDEWPEMDLIEFKTPADAQKAKALFEMHQKRVEELERENIRFHDLVRHQRVALHVQGLITDDEYAELAADTGAVARLETYDRLHNRVDELELELEKAEHSAPSEVMDAIRYCVNTLPDGRAKKLCKNALNWKSDAARIRLYKKELKPLRELAKMVLAWDVPMEAMRTKAREYLNFE